MNLQNKMYLFILLFSTLHWENILIKLSVMAIFHLSDDNKFSTHQNAYKIQRISGEKPQQIPVPVLEALSRAKEYKIEIFIALT